MSSDHEQQALARVGHVLDGKWRLERLLGVGGMAAVYEGRHRNAARGAIKVLHPELAANPDVRKRFLREGYAANQVEHPNVVRVLDDDVLAEGPEAGVAYIVMEFLEGESLAGRMIRLGHALSEIDVLAVAEQVLDVLVAAHAKGIVHRDLKPDNLFLVGPRDEPLDASTLKVLDFGIARLAEFSGKTAAGTMLGTLTYMPPEQACGAKDLDGRADLFALGATMFRALTGRPVHRGKGNELLATVATTHAAPIRSVEPRLSEPIAAIVDRALRFAREDRYPDAATMRDDVRAARVGAPLPSLAAPAPTDASPTLVDAHAPFAGAREMEAPQVSDASPFSTLPFAPAAETATRTTAAVGPAARELAPTIASGAAAKPTSAPPPPPAPILAPILPSSPPSKRRSRGWVALAIVVVLVGLGGAYALERASTSDARPEAPGPVQIDEPNEAKGAPPNRASVTAAVATHAGGTAPSATTATTPHAIEAAPTSTSTSTTTATTTAAATSATTPPGKGHGKSRNK